MTLRKELQVYSKERVLNENPQWRQKSGKNTQITKKDSIQDSFLFFMDIASSSWI